MCHPFCYPGDAGKAGSLTKRPGRGILNHPIQNRKNGSRRTRGAAARRTARRETDIMLRIFLTGDNHIGLKYAGHVQAETLARKRITAFGPMVEKANAEECDLFVIAGDLFDKTAGIAKKTIRELLDLLCAFRGTVVVLPGNHDYYDGEAAVWQDFRREMSGRDNILLLTAFEPRTLQAGDREVVLYPAFCTSRHSEPGKNNLDWIRQQPIPRDGAFRIGLAHGAIAGETIDQEKEYFLMTREELEAIPLDAWLIGHTHVPVPGDLGREYAAAGRIFNAGTHVQKDVHNLTDGLCFLIEIGDDKQVRAKQWVSGNVFFRRLPVAVTAGHMEEEISRALKGLEADSVVELELSGAVTDEEYRGRRRFLEEALSGFLEGSWEDSGLTRLITEDLIDAEFPETSVAAGLLRSLLDDPREAQLAYDLLKSLKGAQPS